MNGDENGYMYTSTGAKNTAAILDQTIAHELKHVIMSSNINPFWDLPSSGNSGGYSRLQS